MSIYTYIKKDHDQMRDIMENILEAGNDNIEKRDKLFNELKDQLILHAKSEEKAFYNPLTGFERTKEEIDHAMEEHKEAEQLLEELTNEDLNGAAWMQKFKKLKDSVEHHMEEEENEIFDDARDVLDKSTEEEMEDHMKKQKKSEEKTRKIEHRHAA